MPETLGPARGTRPEGAVTEADASKKVREMFTQIAPRYDLLNHLLSGELDRLWRARTARILQPLLQKPGALVLDLCCGTGDLAFSLARAGNARIIGVDFAHTMLVRARGKNGDSSLQPGQDSSPSPQFLEADGLQLPFADASFDLVTSAFGFRNLANYETGLREIRRVLKPAGTPKDSSGIFIAGISVKFFPELVDWSLATKLPTTTFPHPSRAFSAPPNSLPS
jgi:demethylmenaquinone methyltransferase / 2-methoxy-6-polyprenyl-1,4-benzoquinol methylase